MRVILLSILLCCVAFSVYGLQCYQCSSQSACENGSNETDCPADSTFCINVYTNDSNTTTLLKACGTNTTCKQYNSNSSIVCDICNDDDLCNSADSTRFSFIGVSLIGFTILRNIL